MDGRLAHNVAGEHLVIGVVFDEVYHHRAVGDVDRLIVVGEGIVVVLVRICGFASVKEDFPQLRSYGRRLRWTQIESRF